MIATSKNYALKASSIFSDAISGRKSLSANDLASLLTELSSRYGQIWTGTKPADAKVGDLFYSAVNGLEICTAEAVVDPATAAVWETVISSSLAVDVYSGARTETGGVPDAWDLSARKIAAYEYNNNPKQPGVGDLVIVTDSTAGETETFIIKTVGTISGSATESDFTVEQITTKNAEEISYDNTASGLNAGNVKEAIDELASAAGAVRRAFYNTASALVNPTAGTEIAYASGSRMPATGLKIATCTITIDGTDGTYAYVACGRRQFVVNGSTIYNSNPDTETLTDYFSSWDDKNGTCPLDVTDLTFAFSGSPSVFKITTTPATTTGTFTVSVRVDY